MKNPDLTEVNHQVRYRGGYADREGIIPINVEQQVDELDSRTRTIINSLIVKIMDDYHSNIETMEEHRRYNTFVERTFLYLYELDYKADNYYNNKRGFTYLSEIITKTIKVDQFEAVFSLLEFHVNNFYILAKGLGDYFENEINTIFKEEYVGYRMINSIITPITDEEEIKEIQEITAMPYEGVKRHIRKAQLKLSDRENPDYENSIKESILSVEAMAKIIVNDNNATLGEALNVMEKKGLIIHPALKSAFHKIYGYTSDFGGIRHAGKIDANSTFAEAKFMLVACSAFNNYLITNMSELEDF